MYVRDFFDVHALSPYHPHMTFGTHMVVATAVALPVLHNPAAAFAVGIASHYIVDAIPHWDWPLKSLEKKLGESHAASAVNLSVGAISIDMIRLAIDMSIGLIALSSVLYVGGASWSIVAVLLAMLGGILPDMLQFIYFATRMKLLSHHQNFHDAVHTDWKIPHHQYVRGVLLQAPVFLIPLFFIFFAAA